jgi:hypothetical protein
MTGFGAEKRQEKGFDCLVTALSNWGLMFVINKTHMPGGGLAEGRRQRDATEIAKIAGIAKIVDLKPRYQLRKKLVNG